MIRRQLIVMVYAALVTATVLAEEVQPQYRHVYGILRDSIYNNDASIDKVEHMASTAHRLIDAENLERDQAAYSHALIEYLTGRAWYNNEGNKAQAAMQYEAAIADIETALDIGETSEVLRLKAEVISQQCLVKSVFYVVANGPKVLSLSRRALELDPENGKALISLAAAKIYPPAAFGGHPQEGIEMMLEALTKPNIEKDDRFNIFSAIGIAYYKLGKAEEAIHWLAKARDLYPGNRYLNSARYMELE